MDDSKETSQMTLGTRMKLYEHDEYILPYMSYMIRLDGKNFSKFTQGFHSPFDKHFTDAMVYAMNDLVEFTHASTGFCCSDEITLVFPPLCTKEEYDSDNKYKCHLYGGRTMKLNTILSSRCSVVFNNIIKKIFLNLPPNDIFSYSPQFLNKIKECICLFDARTIYIPYEKEYECINNLLWRSVYDCHRNSVSTYARHYLGKTKCNKKNSMEMIDMFRETGIIWEFTI